jgi:hypothetical protein
MNKYYFKCRYCGRPVLFFKEGFKPKNAEIIDISTVEWVNGFKQKEGDAVKCQYCKEVIRYGFDCKDLKEGSFNSNSTILVEV